MLFMSEYRKAQTAGEPLPKVLLKLGHWHLLRGMTESILINGGNLEYEELLSSRVGGLKFGKTMRRARDSQAYLPGAFRGRLAHDQR